MRNMVLVDDDPAHLEFNRANAVGIKKFKTDLGADYELANLFCVLQEITLVDDV